MTPNARRYGAVHSRVARTDAGRGHADFERGSAVGHRHAVLGAVKFRKLPLEGKCASPRSAPPHTALKHFCQGVAFSVTVLRPNGKRLPFGSFATHKRKFGDRAS